MLGGDGALVVHDTIFRTVRTHTALLSLHCAIHQTQVCNKRQQNRVVCCCISSYAIAEGAVGRGTFSCNKYIEVDCLLPLLTFWKANLKCTASVPAHQV